MPLSVTDLNLISSAYSGNLQELRDLLRAGANVNARRDDGVTALFFASQNGHVEVVRELLRNNDVNVNLRGPGDATSLYIASQNGHAEVVRELLQNNNVDVNHRPTGGFTALAIASQEGHVEVVRELLQSNNDVDVNLQRSTGATALFMASQEGHVEVVRELLQHSNLDVNLPCTDGTTALYTASRSGHVEVVHKLLQNDDVNVNLQHTDGATALYVASFQGHVEVVRELLRNKDVDVNLQCKKGATSLMMASYNGHVEVVRELLRNNKVDVNLRGSGGFTALEVALERNKHKIARLLEKHIEEEGNRKENSASGDDAKIQRDRSMLLHVMNTASADPVELSLEFIDRCMKKDHKLGSGAYGDVFLAEDSLLPKKFAVKMIRPTDCNVAAIKEIRRSFQTELSTLKRFRHPNIIALYGYSLNVNHTQQCLVYEYANNGSLADFFADDCKRARLSSDTRLSIMFELVRAVHFLHTGSCKVAGKGWKVFHRDIKSANICLADDFTPRLIDCGLAKFVPDANSSATPGPLTASLRNNTDGLVFGTPGYICPEYIRKKLFSGHPCPYIAAYDVYSIGVVLVELILGCLNGVKLMRNDPQRHDVFGMYVQDERGRLVVDGVEKLKRNADRTIIWNPASLDLVCKAAIQCMAPVSEDRLSTKGLLDNLRDAINLNTSAGIQHPEAASAVDSGPYCCICNNYRTDVKCSEGHALCTFCIVDKLGDYSGCQLLCLVEECSSILEHNDLYGRIPIEIYNRALQKCSATELESFSEDTIAMLDPSFYGAHYTSAAFYDETALQRLRHDRVENNVDKCDRAILLAL